MKCDEALRRIVAALDAEGAADDAGLEAHVASCPACSSASASYGVDRMRIASLYEGTVPVSPPRVGMTDLARRMRARRVVGWTSAAAAMLAVAALLWRFSAGPAEELHTPRTARSVGTRREVASLDLPPVRRVAVVPVALRPARGLPVRDDGRVEVQRPDGFLVFVSGDVGPY